MVNKRNNHRYLHNISMILAVLMAGILLLVSSCVPTGDSYKEALMQTGVSYPEGNTLNQTSDKPVFIFRTSTPRQPRIFNPSETSFVNYSANIVSTLEEAPISSSTAAFTAASTLTATIYLPDVTNDGNIYYFPTSQEYDHAATATWPVIFYTARPSSTHGPTFTMTSSRTPKPTMTPRPSRTPTISPTETATATHTYTLSPSSTPTNSPLPPTQTETPSITPSNTQTETPTETPIPSATPSSTSTDTPVLSTETTPETVLPKNGTFAFLSSSSDSSNSELMLADFPGLSPALIADLPITDLCAWSPDGSQLLVQAPRPDTSLTDLVLVASDGTSSPLTGTLPGSSSCGDWLPNDSSILFPYTNPDGLATLSRWIIATGELQPIYSDGSLISQPAVSPDGQTVVFVAQNADIPDLFMLNLGDHSIANLTNTPETEETPRFSADGKTLFFSRLVDQQWKLFTIDLDTLEETCLTISTANERWPHPSPDGQFLLFASDASRIYNVYSLRIGDNEPFRLIPGDVNQTRPLWKP